MGSSPFSRLFRCFLFEAGILQAWSEALDIFSRGAFTTETTNCQYMLGVLYLNKANQDLNNYFSFAQDHLTLALSGYETAGMRGKMADTRYMLALLYKNAALRVDVELAQKSILEKKLR